MSHEGRASRNSPNATRDEPSCDGVASAAGGLASIALVTTFARPDVVKRIEVGDPDAFDDPSCLVYQVNNE